MAKHLHELIVFSDELSLINSPAFYDCVIHLNVRRGVVALDITTVYSLCLKTTLQ